MPSLMQPTNTKVPWMFSMDKYLLKQLKCTIHQQSNTIEGKKCRDIHPEKYYYWKLCQALLNASKDYLHSSSRLPSSRMNKLIYQWSWDSYCIHMHQHASLQHHSWTLTALCPDGLFLLKTYINYHRAKENSPNTPWYWNNNVKLFF